MLHSFDQSYSDDRTSLASGDPTDEQLMERIQNGDESALAGLQNRHHALLRTVIARMIYNAHEVDDLIQDCLVDVWRHAENYSAEKGHVIGWMVTLARRRTIDRIRRKTAYARAQNRFRDEISTDCDACTGADEEAVQCDRAEAVSRLIARLPAAQQEAVHLAFYRGMSQREIAALTGIPLGTIKTRLELALRKLRSSVLAFGELHEPLPTAA